MRGAPRGMHPADERQPSRSNQYPHPHPHQHTHGAKPASTCCCWGGVRGAPRGMQPAGQPSRQPSHNNKHPHPHQHTHAPGPQVRTMTFGAETERPDPDPTPVLDLPRPPDSQHRTRSLTVAAPPGPLSFGAYRSTGCSTDGLCVFVFEAFFRFFFFSRISFYIGRGIFKIVYLGGRVSGGKEGRRQSFF